MPKQTFYTQTKNFIDKTHKEANKEWVLTHLARTEYWALQLFPDADEALRIAAYSHDIERTIKHTKGEKMFDGNSSKHTLTGEAKLKYHQERSAKIMREKLEEFGAPDDLINKVSRLIEKHEVGGDNEQDILKDADSISFLENNVDEFVNFMVEKRGKKAVREKFDWMYERITSPEAKRIAKPFYEVALEKLTNKDD